MLSRLGYTVLVAADGYSGSELFATRHDEIGCVLLDLTMPLLSGPQTYAVLRQVDPGVRVVAMSGYSAEEAAQAFGGVALAGFLPKPFGSTELRATVQQALLHSPAPTHRVEGI